jgi:hypothetical protein
MEPKDSLLCSQEPVYGFFHESQSISLRSILILSSHLWYFLIRFTSCFYLFYYRKSFSFKQHDIEYVLQHRVCSSLYNMFLCGIGRNDMKELGLIIHLPITVWVIIQTVVYWIVTCRWILTFWKNKSPSSEMKWIGWGSSEVLKEAVEKVVIQIHGRGRADRAQSVPRGTVRNLHPVYISQLLPHLLISILRMEVASSFEMLEFTFSITHCHKPEFHSLNSQGMPWQCKAWILWMTANI